MEDRETTVTLSRWRRQARWELLSAVLVVTGLLTLALTGSHAEAGLPAPPVANLSIEKTGSPDPVKTGRTLTYEITVNNLGPDTATNVTVTDKLANSLDFVSADATQGTCDLQGNKLTCDIGTLTADATAPFDAGSTATITLRVKAPAKAGTVANTATVSSDADDPVAANDSATERTRVVSAGGGGGGGKVAFCGGVRATIVGTPANDEIHGTRHRDVIVTGRGNDSIAARGGNDLVCSGDGADIVSGGRGDDRLKTGEKKDFVRGGGGDDRVAGRDGTDTIRGQRGDDNLRGGRGADGIHGGPGIDRCKGGPGQDVIFTCED